MSERPNRTVVIAKTINRAIEICDERGIMPWSQNTTLLGNVSPWRMDGLRIPDTDRLIVNMTDLDPKVLETLDRNLAKSGRPTLWELVEQGVDNVTMVFDE